MKQLMALFFGLAVSQNAFAVFDSRADLRANNFISLSEVKTSELSITAIRHATCGIEIRFPDGMVTQTVFNKLLEKITIQTSRDTFGKEVSPKVKEAVVVYDIPSDLEYFGIILKTKSGESISDALPAALRLKEPGAKEFFDLVVVAKMCD